MPTVLLRASEWSASNPTLLRLSRMSEPSTQPSVSFWPSILRRVPADADGARARSRPQRSHGRGRRLPRDHAAAANHCLQRYVVGLGLCGDRFIQRRSAGRRGGARME